MSKEIRSITSIQVAQNQGYLKLINGVWPLMLLFAVFTAGCQKDNSASTLPHAAITSSLASKPLDVDPGPVNLGSAADFTILSETGISTTGVTSITGNIGVSPMFQPYRILHLQHL